MRVANEMTDFFISESMKWNTCRLISKKDKNLVWLACLLITDCIWTRKTSPWGYRMGLVVWEIAFCDMIIVLIALLKTTSAVSNDMFNLNYRAQSGSAWWTHFSESPHEVKAICFSFSLFSFFFNQIISLTVVSG